VKLPHSLKRFGTCPHRTTDQLQPEYCELAHNDACSARTNEDLAGFFRGHASHRRQLESPRISISPRPCTNYSPCNGARSRLAAEQLRVAGVAGTMQPPKPHSSEEGRRRTECGHNLCAESVSIAPTEMHLSIRTAPNPARVVRRLRLRRSLAREWAARAPQSRRVGEVAHFSLARSGAHFCCGVPQPPPKHWWVTSLTPGSGAWLFAAAVAGAET